LQQQQAAVEGELQARQAAADDLLQEFDRDIADPVDKVSDNSSTAQQLDTCFILQIGVYEATHVIQLSSTATDICADLASY
jgi:hypothetical protein